MRKWKWWKETDGKEEMCRGEEEVVKSSFWEGDEEG